VLLNRKPTTLLCQKLGSQGKQGRVFHYPLRWVTDEKNQQDNRPHAGERQLAVLRKGTEVSDE
jgi:hypothetical protein